MVSFMSKYFLFSVANTEHVTLIMNAAHSLKLSSFIVDNGTLLVYCNDPDGKALIDIIMDKTNLVVPNGFVVAQIIAIGGRYRHDPTTWMNEQVQSASNE